MTNQGSGRNTALLEAVTVPSQRALLDDIEARFTAGQGVCVATMNLDHAVKLRRDPAFRQAYAAHSHVTADGKPIVWLSRLAGRPVDLVTGSDLVDPLVALCAKIGVSIALLGTTHAALEVAAEQLRSRHTGLHVAALVSPPMGFDPESEAAAALIDEVAQSGAKICLLALGAPKQELFAARAFQAQPGLGFVSVGAGIDFVAGTQTRAPRLVQRLAMEWIWRLLGDPRRLFLRYMRCLAILPSLVLNALSIRRADAAGRRAL